MPLEGGAETGGIQQNGIAEGDDTGSGYRLSNPSTRTLQRRLTPAIVAVFTP